MKHIRLGVIGYGFMGRTHSWGCRSLPFHYRDLPFTAELKAVASPSEASRRRAVAEGGFPLVFEDWRALLDSPDVDAVTISAPNALHRDMLLYAIDRGKHIYMDKPLVVRLSETQGIEAALRGRNLTHQMVFHNRFFASTLRAKQLIDEGRLGRITAFRGRYLHAGSIYAERPMGWKQRGDEGGVLLDLGSHIIDLTRFLLGDIVSVWGKARTLYAQRPLPGGTMTDVVGEDHVLLTATLADGACGTLEATKIATGIDDELKLEIHGTKGALVLDLTDEDGLWFFDETVPDAPLGGNRGFTRIRTTSRYGDIVQFPSVKNSSGWLRGHMHCLYSFLLAVSQQRPASPDLFEGIAAQAVMDAASRSFASGREERV